MKVRFGKVLLDVDVTVESTVDDLRNSLKELTDCEEIKLIASGKVLADGNMKIQSIPGGENSKITMIGSKPVNQPDPEELKKYRVRDDLDNSKAVYKKKKSERKKQTNYKFHGIETLPGLKDEERAKKILTELANDEGILAVLEKHKWSVGCLAELYPEGHVGVSEVCVMGLNQNKGQKILLRLRTDDLKGFRKYLSIKKVLYHELAHNEHSEHGDDFYRLMRLIEKESTELNWKNGKSNTLGGNIYHSNNDENLEEPIFNEVHKLGGSDVNTALRSFFPARVLAGTAAIMRLSAEEQEIQDACGSTPHVESNFNLDFNQEENQGDKVENNKTSGEETGSAKPLEQMEIDPENDTNNEKIDANNVNFKELDIVQLDTTESNTSKLNKKEQNFDIHIDHEEQNEKEVENTISKNDMSEQISTGNSNKIIEVKKIHQIILNNVDESVDLAVSLAANSGGDLGAPVQQMMQLRSAFAILLESTVKITNLDNFEQSQESLESLNLLLKCLKLLSKIVSNVKDHMDEKYGNIKKTTNTFQSLIGKLEGAIDVLYAAGFREIPNEIISLSRRDPALLYIVQSLIENSIEIVKNSIKT